VTRACLEMGWAVDRVVSDYGEDLIVQTVQDGIVDTFRTLVQVRSTARRITPSARGPVLRVGSDHALRWSRTAEPVVVVLWHVPSRRGWYAVVQDQITNTKF
jgi:hypothetical protein